jgi:hypothetical protein
MNCTSDSNSERVITELQSDEGEIAPFEPLHTSLMLITAASAGMLVEDPASGVAFARVIDSLEFALGC